MTKISAFKNKKSFEDEPVNLGDRAIDNLRFIRETMERSTVFTTVPGYGGVLMGATAVAAAYIANSQGFIREWLIVWLVEALLAFCIGFLAMWQKAKIAETSLFSAPARKMILNALPPMLCGVFMTLGLWRFGHFEMMIPVWIICYGAAVVCGGAYSVKAVPNMGWCFMTLGAVDFFLPAAYGNSMMALTFGVLHIVFGIIIARKFGG